MFTERATGARQSDKQSQYVRYLIEFSARPKHEWVLLMSAFYTGGNEDRGDKKLFQHPVNGSR